MSRKVHWKQLQSIGDLVKLLELVRPVIAWWTYALIGRYGGRFTIQHGPRQRIVCHPGESLPIPSDIKLKFGGLLAGDVHAWFPSLPFVTEFDIAFSPGGLVFLTNIGCPGGDDAQIVTLAAPCRLAGRPVFAVMHYDWSVGRGSVVIPPRNVGATLHWLYATSPFALRDWAIRIVVPGGS